MCSKKLGVVWFPCSFICTALTSGFYLCFKHQDLFILLDRHVFLLTKVYPSSVHYSFSRLQFVSGYKYPRRRNCCPWLQRWQNYLYANLPPLVEQDLRHHEMTWSCSFSLQIHLHVWYFFQINPSCHHPRSPLLELSRFENGECFCWRLSFGCSFSFAHELLLAELCEWSPF